MKKEYTLTKKNKTKSNKTRKNKTNKKKGGLGIDTILKNPSAKNCLVILPIM